MNSRDTIDCLIRGKKTDRMGLYESFWPEITKKWENQMGNDPTQHFGLDMVFVGGWFDHLPKRGFKQVVEESDEWVILKDGAGASLKQWKYTSGTPEHIDFDMTSREIWEKDYKHFLLEVDLERLDIDGAKNAIRKSKEQGIWSYYGNLFIWEIMRKSLGDTCMLESLLLEPEWIHDFNRVYTDFFKEHYRVLFEKAGKPDGIWLYEDLGYKNGLFCSPKVLEELFLPYYKEIVEFFNSYDLPVILHSCGNITAALPLIVDAGFAALNPMEVKAGCDVIKFAEDYGDKLTFIGGLDVRILESGNKELIKSETIKLIEGMKNQGARYIFGTDHSVTPLVEYEDYTYALDIYREHMKY